MNFCVVEFTDSKDMLVLHESWIVGDAKAYCPPYWGNSYKLRKAVTQMEEPNKLTWAIYNVRILHKTDSFDLANRVLKQAETANTSDLGLDIPQGRGCRKKVQQRLSECSQSSDDQPAPVKNTPKTSGINIKRRRLNESHTNISSPPQISQYINDSELENASPRYVLGPIIEETNAADGRSQTVVEFTPSLEQNRNFTNGDSHEPEWGQFRASSAGTSSGYVPSGNEMKQVFRELAIINAKLDSQGDILDALLKAGSRPRPELNASNTEFSELPLSSEEGLLQLEEAIAVDNTKKMRLIQLLSKSGGSNLNETTYRVLEKLLTDDLAVKYSWAGKTGKKIFKTLAAMKVVREAVKLNPLAKWPSDLEVENAIKYWLKRAQGRLNKVKASNQAAVQLAST